MKLGLEIDFSPVQVIYYIPVRNSHFFQIVPYIFSYLLIEN